MNSQQERDIQLLNTLVDNTEKRLRRLRQVLGYGEDTLPCYTKRPDAWPGGFCAGWAYKALASHAEQLDIRLSKLAKTVYEIKDGKQQKHTYYEYAWTQGRRFRFKRSSIFYDRHIPAGTSWGQSMQEGIGYIRVLAADAFFVEYEIVAYANMQLYRKEQHRTTHAGLIHTLISGIEDERTEKDIVQPEEVDEAFMLKNTEDAEAERALFALEEKI